MLFIKGTEQADVHIHIITLLSVLEMFLFIAGRTYKARFIDVRRREQSDFSPQHSTTDGILTFHRLEATLQLNQLTDLQAAVKPLNFGLRTLSRCSG